MYSSIASGLRTDFRCQFKESFITVKKGAFENFVFRDRHIILLTTSRQKLRCQFSNENVQMASR